MAVGRALAHPLANAHRVQATNDRRPHQEREEERRDRGRRGPEGDISDKPQQRDVGKGLQKEVEQSRSEVRVQRSVRSDRTTTHVAERAQS